MNAQEHQQLLEKFLTLGGNSRFAKSVERFSLSNFAKLRYEWKKLDDRHERQGTRLEKQNTSSEMPEASSEKPNANKVFNDLIADYPVQLHPVFRKRWEVWLLACSLKMQLNSIKAKETEKSLELQWKIYQLFMDLDQCQTILKHYKEHKRIMPTEGEKDFENMSEMEVFKYRNNLRTLITRRKQTIEKMESSLMADGEPINPRKLHSLNLKKEQLQIKLNELLICNKILNDGEE